MASCCICGKGFVVTGARLKDNLIACLRCCKTAGADADDLLVLNDVTSKELKQYIEARKRNESRVRYFQGNITVHDMVFDDSSQTFLFYNWNSFGLLKSKEIYNYADIVGFELLQDDVLITKGGGLGRAVVGGVLLGGVGAIVGGMTGKKKTSNVCGSLKIEIQLKNNPIRRIYSRIIFEGNAVPLDSSDYRKALNEAKESIEALQHAYDLANPTSASNDLDKPQLSGADEIRKYKQLLDDGIITEEEFNIKKRQLLGL